MTNLGRFLVLMARGVQSDTYPCPDWYDKAQAAKWLGIPVPDIAKVPTWWVDRAFIAMEAEAEARKSLENH